MRAAPPLGLIHDLRQQQDRLDRIEELADVKRAHGGSLAAGENIGDVFSRAPLRHQPRAEIVAAAAQLADCDFRVGARKTGDGLFGQRPAVENVDTDDAFLLGRRNRPVPFGAPIRFRCRSEARAVVRKQQQQNCPARFDHTLVA